MVTVSSTTAKKEFGRSSNRNSIRGPSETIGIKFARDLLTGRDTFPEI